MINITVADNVSDSLEALISKTGNDSVLLTTYLSLGNIYIQKDDLPEAMDYYNKAIVIAKKINDSTKLPRLYNNLGILNLYLNNNQKALSLYSKALQLFKAINDSVNVAGTITNMGSVYINLGDYKTAKKYYLQGYNLFKLIGLPEGEAHALLKIGVLEIKQKNYDSALVHLNESINKLKEVGTTYSGDKELFLAETLIYKGIALINKSEYDKAFDFLNRGMKIAKENHDWGLMSQASEYISRYYAHKNDYKKALEFYTVFKQASDSINNYENIKKIARLEARLHYKDRLHKKTLENRELVEKQQRNRLYFYLFASILTLGLALLFLLFLLEKNKKKKAELAKVNLEQKLEHANKELTTHVMFQLRTNEFILSVSEKLKQAKIDAKTENKQRIGELINELERNSNLFSWDEFELRFQQVYTGFYKNLYEKFPNLTRNEIRLCAFAKLNMTTKEIAAITFQSINSITVARYRLRKKLGLQPNESLHSFLADM